ncbi:MAG TPA: HAMP domain-containing sensor histidine kinase [Bacteroidales bacterium]|nr:HAMP domain-containing sensor histidine kinase [Bacteroidales bacterium]
MLRRTASVLVSLFLVQGLVTSAPLRVDKGVLDLRHIEQGDMFSVKMNGEWEFYFSKFLYGEPGHISDTLTPDCYGTVPGYWAEYSVDGKNLPRFGYGTYRAVILLPDGYRDRLGFDMPVFDTSYEIALNGITTARNGTPARSRAESIPAYEPLFFSYVPNNDTIELLIRVSNYEHRRGGFWLPLKVGTFHTIQSNFTNQWFISIAVTGMLFAAFIFFFTFYLYDRKNHKLLMFSLLALSLALRPFLSTPYLISIVDVTNWNLIVKGEYILLYLTVTSGAWLAYYIYPTSWFRKTALAVDFAFLAGAILVISTPAYIFSYTVWIMQALAILVLMYALVMSLRGLLKKNWIDIIYFAAIIALGAGAIADIMLSNGLEENQQIYILSFMMMVFVFVQAALLIREWVNSGRERVKLALQLEELNRSLEDRVEERTKELKTKSMELNARNEQIALQNKKLSETIHLKNKVFSVIAHDLRSPVVNILYTLHLLREEKDGDKTEAMANSCIQYSQMLISLIENMLVWGREQEDMIRFAPSENDLADIVLTNISILKDSADRKNISLNFTQVGKAVGWIDRDLIDIVVRNLLSNAIKYTNPGGKVTISVKEQEKNNAGVVIKICDNGVGISEERQRKLFTGAEIDTTTGTDSEKGTGIGLKLVHELVTISKGTISVESKLENGSCFTVSLPSAAPAGKARGQ